MRHVRRIAILLVLGILLGASGSFAAEAQPADRGSVFSQVWDFFSALWSDSGCIIDPLGRCVDEPSEIDEGCGMDPLGRCRVDHQ